jgi:hypothetical protein
MNLELGVGANPATNHEGSIWHDRITHSDYIDIAWDLNKLPWPWDSESIAQIVAVDVMEHLELQPQEWLDEAWRILVPQGLITMRLPAWDNPLSYRDPTHRRVFHEESFYYWDKRTDLYQDYGRYYFAESDKWWHVMRPEREYIDIRFTLVKDS